MLTNSVNLRDVPAQELAERIELFRDLLALAKTDEVLVSVCGPSTGPDGLPTRSNNGMHWQLSAPVEHGDVWVQETTGLKLKPDGLVWKEVRLTH